MSTAINFVFKFNNMSSLIQKYNIPGPRYTSYPTVPFWDESLFSIESWKNNLVNSFKKTNKTEGISLYIHLPFCESLCTFCGCNKRITKRHDVELPYIAALLKEWNLYCQLFDEKPIIKEIHLGGGTPTFFSKDNLEILINGLFEKAIKAVNYYFSFEGHPNNTTKAHLQKLFDLGFRSVSFGVQDYNYKVQSAIHRIQTFQQVAKVSFWAKEIGYTSIGHDLIYGLPLQNIETITDTVEKTRAILPDRLAFYSYAHVPWIKGTGQRGFEDTDIPIDDVKRELYEIGKQKLLQKGYVEIGMDHFALPKDSLLKASKNGHLHRNFMGYTASKTQVLIGLGVSSISDCWSSFAQNEKKIETYFERLEANELPVFRGHILTKKDEIIRKHILNIICNFSTSWEDDNLKFDELETVLNNLAIMKKDGLVQIFSNSIQVTELGKPFIRNICMAFDLRMIENRTAHKLFSMTI